MYKTIDLRDESFRTIPEICHRIEYYKAHYPTLDSVIISLSQRETLVKNDPILFSASLDLSQKFEKPAEELDFRLVFEGCRVEVE